MGGPDTEIWKLISLMRVSFESIYALSVAVAINLVSYEVDVRFVVKHCFGIDIFLVTGALL